MSNIEELQARVVSAEARLALIGEEHQRYSDRLVSLMGAAEAQISEQSAEAAMRQAALDSLHQENEQLRTMLHTLLLAVEAGKGKVLAATMHDLEAKFSTMLVTKADDETAGDVEAPAADAETGAPADDAAETDTELAMPAPDDADAGAMEVEAAADTDTGAEAAEIEVADADVVADDATDAGSAARAEPMVDPAAALDATMSDGLDATGDDDPEPLAMAPADDDVITDDDAVARADAEDEIAFEDEPLSLEAEEFPADDTPPADARAETIAGADHADAPVPNDAEPAETSAEVAEATDVAADETATADGDNAADALLAMHTEEDPQSADLGFADAPPASAPGSEDESPMKQILHGVRQQLADSDRSAAVG